MVRRIVCRELAGPEAMRLEEVPAPPLGPGQVRVAVRAAGVNFPDILMTYGKYQLRPPLPFTPGVEAAGDVVECAADVSGVRVGDQVITKHRVGGYTDEIVLAAADTHPLPPGFDYAEGACFMVGYHTAYHGLVQRGQVGPGQVLLVHGAAGGVGLGAVEIGKLLGATVIATGSRDDKLAVVKARGADHVINYVSDNFRERVKELTDGRGADVIYDPVGGDVFDESLRCIAWNGRLLVVGFAGGRIPAAPANLALLKGCAVVGVRAGEFGRRNPAAAKANQRALLDWAAAGKLKPHISHRLPLERFAEAMAVLSDRKAVGRVALLAR
ncbi:MAG TPA: NADPH:quinone oxidoreductase family protein [Candidatus Sulfotelmatobacter sp.]|nr:NADPH:quinone oxidoreductase family protein [Candidatus Sulfotelmatobacter sp.]